MIGHLTHCQACNHTELELVLDLGHHAMVQGYLTSEGLHEPEATFPLALCRCTNCQLVQLDYTVDPQIVFPKSYPYRSGLTNMLIRNFRQLADTLETSGQVKAGELIIDIGSNDGTLLQAFKDKGMSVLGIEPTDAAIVANENGIPTIQEYISPASAKRVRAEHGPARIIAATNVFAHIDNAPELMAAISEMLDDKGIFVSESQYLLDIVEKLEYDTVYHEHLRFYSLKPLKSLLESGGFSVVDAERIGAAGGSIRVFARKGKHDASSRVQDLIAAEEAAGLYDGKKLQEFAARVQRAKFDLVALLLRCKQDGKRIVGLGSPARSNTLLNYTHIDHDILDYNCEKAGSPKIGLFTPGTHIPVVDEQRLFDEQPEYCLILSWHIAEELAKKVRDLGYKGKFIAPMPIPRILD